MKLLQSPQADAFARASELARESARFNPGSITRTINVPDVALEYLLPQHLGRMQSIVNVAQPPEPLSALVVDRRFRKAPEDPSALGDEPPDSRMASHKSLRS